MLKYGKICTQNISSSLKCLMLVKNIFRGIISDYNLRVIADKDIVHQKFRLTMKLITVQPL